VDERVSSLVDEELRLSPGAFLSKQAQESLLALRGVLLKALPDDRRIALHV
jgi:hypothetical protein